MSVVERVLAWFRDAYGDGEARGADGARRSGGTMDIKHDRMVFLGYGKYWRSDGIIGLMPIEDERGPKRRTNVFVEGRAEPIVASRTEQSILEDMGATDAGFQAQAAREIFPEAPLKYMPPTKHMTGNVFRGYEQNTLFALTSVATRQSIHLLGMLTEALHTPFLHDRWLAIDQMKRVRANARHLGEELRFAPDGRIARRAREVLAGAESILQRVAGQGLFGALAEGVFADTRRRREGGRGFDCRSSWILFVSCSRRSRRPGNRRCPERSRSRIRSRPRRGCR